jgi:hypothetical protein
LDLLADKQALHNLPVILCQSRMVQAHAKLQAVPQGGISHTFQGVLWITTTTNNIIINKGSITSSSSSSRRWASERYGHWQH